MEQTDLLEFYIDLESRFLCGVFTLAITLMVGKYWCTNMKYNLFIILFSLSGLTFAADQVTIDDRVIEIDVKGMTCPFCQDGLHRNLNKLPGVKGAEVSLKLKKARIFMQPGQSLDEKALRNTVIDSGFTPGEIRQVK